MAEVRGGQRPHILVEGTATPEPYTYPWEVRGGSKLDVPPRDRQGHGHAILAKLDSLREELEQLKRDRQAVGISEDRGLYLEFQSDPQLNLALESLDRTREGIELLATRRVDGVHYAAVLVPEGKLKNLERMVERYLTEEDNRSGLPKNKTLVESIADIHRAALVSFWTDDLSKLPRDGESAWWEVWLRGGTAAKEILADFTSLASTIDLDLKKEVLFFPERTVLLAKGTPEQMRRSVELLDCIAELRRAKEPPSFYVGLSAQEQMEWVKELVQRTSLPSGEVPAVCILDTGVNNGHPLLQGSIDDESLLTYNPEWGTADHHSHGTEMAGLALYGDLAEVLRQQAPVTLEHQLESVKILPPPPFPANEPDLYGAITRECVSRAEIAAPRRKRAICMAVTAPDYDDRGKPSSWSSEVDQIAAGVGDEDENRRLVIISAGSVQEPEWRMYPDYNDVAQVEDPGQSWNAVTVGAYTARELISDPQYRNWEALAEADTLSPSSPTSLSWVPQWPNKPDIVLEGGNAARESTSGDPAPLDDLVLLTTNWQPTDKALVPTWGTSPATAQAGRMAAILMARYSDLWPESIRALLVHSADWTSKMVDQVAGLSDAMRLDVLLRRHGYGVPDLDFACWSAANVLTIVAQEQIQPFDKPEGAGVKTRDMNFHKLPWPKQALEDLGEVPVEMRVTLSYFIEPNPAERGWTRKHRYHSHGLRFHMKKLLESDDDFRARVSKDAQDEDEGVPFPGDSDWHIGEARRNRGSIHSDRWNGPARELAGRDRIAVFPVGGWWKERAHLGRWKNQVRYSLVVTIRAPEVGVDIYTPVEAMVKVPVPVPVPVPSR